uniref:LRRCT domain-containing protein n=1 Tax=Anopheles epiroticus TaxID=199890 RepID=A0A182PUI3_9DIPT
MAVNAPKAPLQHVVWLASAVLAISTVVLVSGELVQTAKVCQYMQCTTASVGENEAMQLTLRFNKTMWAEYHESLNRPFDFTSWNWSELDNVTEMNHPVELIFNGLDVPHVDIMEGHVSVVSLNLDDNQITGIEKDAFANFKNLTTLSLRRNMITVVNEFFYHPNHVKHLDLSHNQIGQIDGFKSFTWASLTHLNLSYNRLNSLRTELSKLEALETLDLSHNAITKGDKPIILPRSLVRAQLDHNELLAWPFDSLPDTLTHLSLSSNRLGSTKDAPGVIQLDLSSNRLASFCGHCFPALEVLDLSSNYFESFPRLSDRNGAASLRKVSFNRMPHIGTIEKGAFDGADNLEEIEISFCPRLSSIESHAFTGLKKLKRLDLSYNALQQVPEDMVHWRRLTEGVDLQGNPINCNCSMQWFVGKVIPLMHSRPELHSLFPQLVCAQPPMYRGYLLVYLTVHDNLLCRKYVEMDLPGMEQVVQSMREHRQMQLIRAQKIILACLIVGIVALSSYLAYLKCNKPRYRVRPIYYQ